MDKEQIRLWFEFTLRSDLYLDLLIRIKAFRQKEIPEELLNDTEGIIDKYVEIMGWNELEGLGLPDVPRYQRKFILLSRGLFGDALIDGNFEENWELIQKYFEEIKDTLSRGKSDIRKSMGFAGIFEDPDGREKVNLEIKKSEIPNYPGEKLTPVFDLDGSETYMVHAIDEKALYAIRNMEDGKILTSPENVRLSPLELSDDMLCYIDWGAEKNKIKEDFNEFINREWSLRHRKYKKYSIMTFRKASFKIRSLKRYLDIFDMKKAGNSIREIAEKHYQHLIDEEVEGKKLPNIMQAYDQFKEDIKKAKNVIIGVEEGIFPVYSEKTIIDEKYFGNKKLYEQRKKERSENF